ncbi:hypothetical protein [Amycolatopsis sp. cmx-4-61]|uniref:hypothetical protein n=1 Tax=Amycolatopsis sp. cmx-4-61 TaxID=2790937 RepID=UPI00397B81CF
MTLEDKKLSGGLGAAFGGGRGAGLGSLLDADDPDPTGDEEPSTVPVATEKRTPRRRDRSVEDTTGEEIAPPPRRRPRAQRTSNEPAQVTVYVSLSVRKRFDEYKHKERLQSRDVVFRALAARREDLRRIIDESKYYLGEVNELFAPDESKARYVGGGSEGQVQFKPKPQHEAVLRQLEDELGMDKRSTWIAPILNDFLPGKKDTKPGAKKDAKA